MQRIDTIPRVYRVPLPLVLFLCVRLPLLVALTFDGLRGYGDLLPFFNLADIPGLPYLHYWVEFPPAFVFINELLYAASGGVEHVYTYLLVFLLLAADIGCILVFLKLEQLLHSSNTPTWRSLTFAVILAGLPYAWWYFDSLAVFFSLLALYLGLSKGKTFLAGTALGIGILVKLFPALILPALVRALPPRRSIAIMGTALAVFVLPFLLLFAASPTFTRASIAAQTSRGSWETVWALIDGNDQPGGFGPLIERLDPQLAKDSARNPSTISPVLVLAGFGLLGFVLMRRASLSSPVRILAFYGLTMAIFFIASSGWSTQWVLHLLPVALLVLPLYPGFLLTILLVFINLVEWPLLLSRGLNQLLPVTVVLRLLLMVILGVLFYQRTKLEEKSQINEIPQSDQQE